MPTPTRDELVDLIAVKIPYVTKEFGHYTAMRILQHLEENGVELVPHDPTQEQCRASAHAWGKDIYWAMIEAGPYRGIRVPDSSPFVPQIKSIGAMEVGKPFTVELVGFDAGDGSSD